jgi:hypothetical protein
MSSRLATATLSGGPAAIDLLAVQPHGPSGNWGLVFQDEFAGSALDTTKWNLYGATMNNVTTSAGNIAVANSILALTLASTTSGATLTTGSIGGLGNEYFRMQVGDYSEARISYPGTGGSVYNWSAFWASGFSWPANGEHDITEILNGVSTLSYHNQAGGTNPAAFTPSGYWGTSFHTFGLLRGSSTAQVYWDGTQVDSYATNDQGGTQAVILTQGFNAGYPTKIGDTMLVDYVRVFRPR